MRKIMIEAIVTKEAKNFSQVVSEMGMTHKYSNGIGTAWACEIKDADDGIAKMTQLEANGIGHKIWGFENGKMEKLSEAEKQEFGKPIYMAWKQLI
jgi:hypothetical protein